MQKIKLFLSWAFIPCFVLLGCQPTGPDPITFGVDQCHYCRMTIAEPNYGAELITEKGRVYKYDAAECMVNQLKEEDIPYRELYAVAYDKPQQLFPVSTLAFIISPDFRSPMGANLAAVKDKTSVKGEYEFLSWEEVMIKVEK